MLVKLINLKTHLPILINTEKISAIQYIQKGYQDTILHIFVGRKKHKVLIENNGYRKFIECLNKEYELIDFEETTSIS
ncbi:MAG: hypothetical protein LBJ97_00490 [Mycoplasmataceae bacterium]|jgi:hypothetical protein|nr:hypothetical protein [Mycoplasmataceae bacterium]